MKKFLALLILHFAFCILNSFSQAPTYSWAKSIGNPGTNEAGYSIAIDNAGNTYTTGRFNGTVDFDPGPGVFYLTSTGNVSIFITKMDASGNFIWAKEITGSSTAYSTYITVDELAGIYITGYFFDTLDCDPGAGVFNLISGNQFFQDGFITKLDSAGNFSWAKSLKAIGTGSSQCSSVFVDHTNTVYCTGYFENTVDFDPSAGGSFNMSTSGMNDANIFILKLDNVGNFVWAKQIVGGTMFDTGTSIGSDQFGNVYTAGYFQNTADFDPGPGTFNLTSAGGYDIFLSKLNSAGNFVWAKRIGGPYHDVCNSMKLIGELNTIYCTGLFTGTADFDPGPGTYNLTSTNTSEDIFTCKYDTTGNLIWAKAMNGPGFDEGLTIAVDSFQSVYTTGYFEGTVDFNPDTGTFNLTSSGGADIFITKLDYSGNFVWAKSTGGSGDEYGESICSDPLGNIYLTGEYTSALVPFDLDTLANSDTTTGNIFIAKLPTCAAYFSVYPDVVPHNWFALNQASGVLGLSYLWDWGDGDTSHGAYPSHVFASPANYNICLTVNDGAGCVSTYCDSSTYLSRTNGSNTIITLNVVSQLPTGIQEQPSNENEVSVYPNPATSAFTIDLGNYNNRVDVIITDFEGKTIFVTDSRGESKFNVNTKDFAVGIYAVRIQSADFIETRKLIINK